MNYFYCYYKDPRQEVHDEITWSYMQPESVFLLELIQFVDQQTPRFDLPTLALVSATLFFGSCAETTIEEKHARVSLQKKAHRIGPVKVSLANRFPQITRQLERQQVDVLEFIDAFSDARSLIKIPSLLNIESHPELRSIKSLWKMNTELSKILYNCDMYSLYRSQADAMAVENKAALELLLTTMLIKSLLNNKVNI